MHDVPYGYCHCGCGQHTTIAKKTERKWGHVRGEPVRFVSGHQRRISPDEAYVVDPETGCWVWQRYTDGRYGGFEPAGRRVLAHRWFYERAHGPVDPGLELDHLCRNTLCVNPDHLEPVTHAENCRRGRVAKLSMEIANQIRSTPGTQQELAKRFGVAPSTIWRIQNGKAWT